MSKDSLTQDALVAALDVKVAMLEQQLYNQDQTIAFLQTVIRETMVHLRSRNGPSAIRSLRRAADTDP
jgi:hypothetical protein